MPVLTCTKRNESIKTNALRRNNFIPAIIYGKNLKKPVKVQVNNIDITRLLKETTIGSVVTVIVDGKNYNTMLKEVKYIPLKTLAQHADFQVLTLGEKIKTSAPIHFINKDKISLEGVLNEHLYAIEYEVLPVDIVDFFEVDLSKLIIGGDIKLQDIIVFDNEKYSFITPSETSLVSLAFAKKVVEEADEVKEEEEVEVEEEVIA